MSPRLQVQLEQQEYAPGETVKGTILVVEGGSSRSLEALLEYKEETEDYREVAISIPSGPLHEGDLTTGTSVEFQLSLPADALPNYQSEHGELYWEVDAKSNEFARDTHERTRIQVGPPQGRLADGPAEPAPSHADRQGSPRLTTTVRVGRRRKEVDSSGLVRWLTRGFFAIGVVALVVGVVTLVRTVQFVQRAEHATGTVIDLSRETDSEGSVTFYPVVRFTTGVGKTIEFKSSSGSSPPSHSEGDTVDVLYDPDDPNDARLSGLFDLWLLPAVALALGVAFLGVTAFVSRRS
jgi:hypothetical protein